MRDYFFLDPNKNLVPVAEAPTEILQYHLLVGLKFRGTNPDVTPENFKERCRIELTARELEGRL